MFKKIVWLWFSSTWKNAKDVKKYIDSLVKSWAWEFFVWYNPSYWSDKFGFEVSPNGRFSEHEQVTSIETLKQIVLEVHNHKLEIFINLNAWYYTPETMPYIERMVEEFIELWIDWIICWNISILEYLKDIEYSWKINISTILAVYNKEAIRFFLENYNINKVILSREVTLKEIESISKEFPKMNFEVFWEWDFCRYNNWLCYAEHKYWAKDICTVVVNDLIIKKKYRPDFKNIILDESLSNEEKICLMNDSYSDLFEQISLILEDIELDFKDKFSLEKDLLKLIYNSRTRVDLFFDWLKPLNSKRNKDLLTYLRWVKYLLKQFETNKIPHSVSPKGREVAAGLWNDGNIFQIEKEKLEKIKLLETELNNSFKSYLEFNKNKLREIWWEAKLKALELWSFYAKWDNLNLYSYLFFDKIPNVDTVKFPTRWRNYSEKIKLIDDVLKKWEIDESFFDRWINIERAHYDLTYLFWDKLWFRNLLNKK